MRQTSVGAGIRGGWGIGYRRPEWNGFAWGVLRRGQCGWGVDHDG